MRIANHEGRLVVVTGDPGHELAHDVEKNSSGRFGPEPQASYEDWDAFTGWAAGTRWEGGEPVRPNGLGSPVPAPRQVFGIGLNYRDHAGETNAQLPPAPLTFTKFPSCIAGPTADVPLSGAMVDWEVEIVVVIGDRASNVPVADAWSVVAGLTLGQDISDRAVQMTGVPPQFSLGKSFRNFGPTGPALVSVDAFPDPDDVALWCDVAGERMQDARSSQLIFSIPTLVAYLSSICVLYPGDVIFTGTPSGVGMARGRFLQVGEVIVSGADVIGELRNVCVTGTGPLPT
jgi:2,4-diketo-3-deoxy-L-fuconate hydrolase